MTAAGLDLLASAGAWPILADALDDQGRHRLAEAVRATAAGDDALLYERVVLGGEADAVRGDNWRGGVVGELRYGVGIMQPGPVAGDTPDAVWLVSPRLPLWAALLIARHHREGEEAPWVAVDDPGATPQSCPADVLRMAPELLGRYLVAGAVRHQPEYVTAWECDRVALPCRLSSRRTFRRLRQIGLAVQSLVAPGGPAP